MFLIDDIFKAIGKKKAIKGQAEEEKKFRATQAQRFGEDEANRSARLGGIANFLSKYTGPGGSSGVNMPSYGVDPGTLAQLQKARTFVPDQAARTTKGAGFNMLGDIASGAGNALLTAYSGGLFDKANPGAVGGFGGVPFDPEKLPGLGGPIK